MAIAHIATEYVFSDFMLKDSSADNKYKGLRQELALDKIVSCLAVGLPLLLISLAFAQEISMGSQISCFAPSTFSWRQAAYVDSFCWAALQQKHLSNSESGNIPLWLHKFFPYILLFVAILLYLPSLIWRFTAAPHLSSDLKFIMEELDKAYNRAIKAANTLQGGDKKDGSNRSPVIESLAQSLWEISESHFKYPLVEQYLQTKKGSRNLILKYLFCRLLTFFVILLACIYLGYYISLFSLTDEFTCNIRSGILKNDTTLPALIQCKLIAVGVFQLLSYINIVVYVLLLPLVIYTIVRPLQKRANVLKAYELLPTFDVLQFHSELYDDLSLFLLYLEENISELKSYKCLKVLENIKGSGQMFDTVQLLTTLGAVKTDVVDGKLKKIEQKAGTASENETELKDVSASNDAQISKDDQKLRQRLVDSSC
ncbi:pannexin-1 [Ambystoma mexicanum]|uniref:pannexin-1 n=1 Tax=Ambystoma mexicanum TaxID=8296 RepID=UPI0037E96727